MKLFSNEIFIDVKVSWDGYEEKENPPEVVVPVQTEPTLLGFGKPLAIYRRSHPFSMESTW